MTACTEIQVQKNTSMFACARMHVHSAKLACTLCIAKYIILQLKVNKKEYNFYARIVLNFASYYNELKKMYSAQTDVPGISDVVVDPDKRVSDADLDLSLATKLFIVTNKL